MIPILPPLLTKTSPFISVKTFPQTLRLLCAGASEHMEEMVDEAQTEEERWRESGRKRQAEILTHKHYTVTILAHKT